MHNKKEIYNEQYNLNYLLSRLEKKNTNATQSKIEKTENILNIYNV